MPRKYSKNKRSKRGGKTRKQKMYIMKGCSRKKRVFSSLGKKQRGGRGCGSGGCPIAPFSWKQMNMMGGTQVGGAQVGGTQVGGKYQYPPNNVMKMQTILPQDKYPLGASGQIGGTCGGTCGLQPPAQMGGGFYKPAAPIPGPFVGKPWGTSLSKWPVMDGIGGDRNYLKNYKNVLNNDPQQQQLTADVDAGYKTWSSMVGGYKYNTNSSSKSLKSRSNSSSRTRRGGGLIPQDLVNLGQDATYNLKSAYNTLNGYSKPVSPLPYQGQLTGSMDYNKLLL